MDFMASLRGRVNVCRVVLLLTKRPCPAWSCLSEEGQFRKEAALSHDQDACRVAGLRREQGSFFARHEAIPRSAHFMPDST